MTTLAARTINALRLEHDSLANLVPTLSENELTGPSGASEWSVAQVLSHLGSGSEINLVTLRAALGEGEEPGDEFNKSVWDRWDAMTAAEQRAAFLVHNQALVAALEGLTTEQHDSLKVQLAFLPAPLNVASYAGLRLNEAAHHGWDVRVAVQPEAGLLDSSTELLFDHMAGDLGFLIGFLGKADQLEERVVLEVGGGGHTVVIDDAVSLGAAVEEATATLQGPPEAALRLLFGRLGPAFTPADVTVTGNVSLDQLRVVFPGF